MTRLGPGDMPTGKRPVQVVELPDDLDQPVDDAVVAEIEDKLKKLRAPFPPEMIEKLPKPLYKNAWEGKKAARCNICHGYHVLDDCIHLDYVGHANTTNRLLEVDLFWEWEPLAYTAEGLPLFTKTGGLWIKLTICGVTRLGYGDGKEPKEIIGDAIRNAAMRFGVALDLWSKIDLHAERNPGDGETPRRGQGVGRRGVGQASGDSGPGQQSRGQNKQSGGQPLDETRAPNQDALDSLQSVCDEYGFDTRWAADTFESNYGVHVTLGKPDDITAFAANLIEQATPDSAADNSTDGDGEDEPDAARHGDTEMDAAGREPSAAEMAATPGADEAQQDIF